MESIVAKHPPEGVDLPVIEGSGKKVGDLGQVEVSAFLPEKYALVWCEEADLEPITQAGTPADGETLEDPRRETGTCALAGNRGGRWTYRPRDNHTLDGAPERLEPPADLFGQNPEEMEE
jgi:hypothetical protein